MGLDVAHAENERSRTVVKNRFTVNKLKMASMKV
jgi:hypothetical protein